MLRFVFYGPYRLVSKLRKIIALQTKMKRGYPNGGRCHYCGAIADPGEKICEACAETSAW